MTAQWRGTASGRARAGARASASDCTCTLPAAPSPPSHVPARDVQHDLHADEQDDDQLGALALLVLAHLEDKLGVGQQRAELGGGVGGKGGEENGGAVMVV